MTLEEEAHLALKIRNAFTAFANALPDQIQEIERTNGALNALSLVLFEVHEIIDRDGRRLAAIEPDLRVVHMDITFTLLDVSDIISRMGRDLLTRDYYDTWAELMQHFKFIGNGKTLALRLEIDRRFLIALLRVLKHEQLDFIEYRDLQSDVHSLTSSYVQARPQGALEAPANGHSFRVTRRISYERPRPPRIGTSDAHNARRPTGYVPQVPSPPAPASPTDTFSSISQVSSLDREIGDHWSKTIFDNASSTRLRITDEQSRFHTRQDNPTDSRRPDETYKEAMRMDFATSRNTNLQVTFYCRVSDLDAKMMVTIKDRRGRDCYSVLPMKKLALTRSGCMLRFARIGRDRRSTFSWISLQFTNIERLTLFATTFVAMRALGGDLPTDPDHLWDDEYQDEFMLFSGNINDRKHRRRLYILHDRPSGAVRLLVAKRAGRHAGTPVWVAFVHHALMHPTWCERNNRSFVLLNALQYHIFNFKYEVEKAPNGAYVLDFEKSSDAVAFVETMDMLRGEFNRQTRR